MIQKILTVCRMPQGKKYAPGIDLKGEYLKKYGFDIGDMVKVEFQKHKIIISKDINTDVLQGFALRNPALLNLIEKLDLEIA